LGKDARSTKFYKKDYFTWWYDDNALVDLLKPANGKWIAQSELLYDAIYEDAKRNNKRHKWTYVEDVFIKSNYLYLSDNVIGLALNIPGRIVKLRRLALGLKKVVLKDSYKVIVWCDRKDYESDLQEYLVNHKLPSKDRRKGAPKYV
jgi:hypothetical protein